MNIKSRFTRRFFIWGMVIMTKEEAEQYLFQTSWYELVKIATGQPIPLDIEKKREEAYRILESK